MILEKNKLIVPNKDITYFLAPDYIYVPASKIYVKNNDYVYKNQVVADTTISSVSGYVLGIKKCNVLGKTKNTVVIQNDYREYFKDNKVKSRITILNMLKLLEKDKVLFNKFKITFIIVSSKSLGFKLILLQLILKGNRLLLEYSIIVS